MDRETMIKEMGKLMAGLAVPVSLGAPLGAAREAWGTLHSGLRGFGWASAEQYEDEIRRVLSG